MTRDIFKNYSAIYLTIKYLPPATATEMKSCVSVNLNTEITAQKMILSNLFLQRLQYFRAQVQRELLEGE